jgi:hypothetical protein
MKAPLILSSERSEQSKEAPGGPEHGSTVRKLTEHHERAQVFTNGPSAIVLSSSLRTMRVR